MDTSFELCLLAEHGPKSIASFSFSSQTTLKQIEICKFARLSRTTIWLRACSLSSIEYIKSIDNQDEQLVEQRKHIGVH